MNKASPYIDISGRKLLLEIIYKYYRGELNNFEFEDCFFQSSDQLITEIIKNMGYYYDDTYCHLWFEFYDKELQELLEIWCFLLRTNCEFFVNNDSLKETKNNVCAWRNVLQKNNCLCPMGNVSIPHFYPIITCFLLRRQIELMPKYKLIFKGLTLKENINKLISVIDYRDITICSKIWNANGYCQEHVISKIQSAYGTGVISPRYQKIILKILPEDSIFFALPLSVKNEFTKKSIGENDICISLLDFMRK